MRHIPIPLNSPNSIPNPACTRPRSSFAQPRACQNFVLKKGAVPSRPSQLRLRQTHSVSVNSVVHPLRLYLCTWYCDDEITRYSAIFAWFVVFVPVAVIAVSTLCFIWLDIVPCNM